MSLIRNGGFERGNTDFWSAKENCTLEINDTDQKYGLYCGKITSAGNALLLVQSDDYIAVSPYQIINTLLWIKSSAARDVYLCLYTYDSDYSYIDRIESSLKTMDGNYQMFHAQFSLPENVSYVRFGLRINLSNSGEIFYIDGAGVDILQPETGMSGIATLLASDMYTGSGNTVGDKKSMIQYSTYYGQLICTDAFGTSETLDVTVYELNEDHYEVELASFPQVTTTGSYLIDLPHCEGREMYIRYTFGGTDPMFAFSVRVIGKG